MSLNRLREFKKEAKKESGNAQKRSATKVVGKQPREKKPFFKANQPNFKKGARNSRNSKMVYIGNLNYKIKEKDLVGIFGQFGRVGNVKLVIDLKTKRSKGIAFVEMFDADDMAKAISYLNGKTIDGRVAKVSEAIPQTK